MGPQRGVKTREAKNVFIFRSGNINASKFHPRVQRCNHLWWFTASTSLLFLEWYYCSFPFFISISPEGDHALMLGPLKRNGGRDHPVDQVNEIIKEKMVPSSINGNLSKNNFKFNFACIGESYCYKFAIRWYLRSLSIPYLKIFSFLVSSSGYYWIFKNICCRYGIITQVDSVSKALCRNIYPRPAQS